MSSPTTAPAKTGAATTGAAPGTASQGAPRDEIAAYHLIDETRLVDSLMERAIFTADERARISNQAAQLVRAARANRHKHGGIDAFMAEYGLSTDEGVILMCLAEALLRIPDKETVDALIAEKIGDGQWLRHLGRSDSLLVNASTFGLMITGGVVRLGRDKGSGPGAIVKRLVSRSGEPVIRQAVRQAMRVLGDSFVLGRSIEEALARAAPMEARGYRFSYDMLGERARSAADADKYFGRYMAAADAIGRAHPAGRGITNAQALLARPGLSVKLSALHPRFDPGKEDRLKHELLPRLIELAIAARRNGLMLTIDAEEQDRLDLTLTLFAAAFAEDALKGWPGLGLAVQAYGKRAIPVLRWLRRLARREGKPIPLRLVKGAYWDSEIKWAQERGLSDYPVLTRKVHTDLSWLACMRLMMADPDAFLPQLATHNALSIAAVTATAPSAKAYELQRLHGMGEAIYQEVIDDGAQDVACRIYAPVGPHEDLVSYLVRRLLENGANTSFVNRLADAETPVDEIVRDPMAVVEAERSARAVPRLLPRPPELYAPERRNSSGLALDQPALRGALIADIEAALAAPFAAAPIVDGSTVADRGTGQVVRSPHDLGQHVGTVRVADVATVEQAIAGAQKAAHAWDRLGGPARAAMLEAAATLYERNRARLMAVLVREAGKTLENALGDVREAVDFLRYYASEARRLFSGPVDLKGPTGERNTLELRARGPFACISPWNFPLAIFTGQIAAALAAGNPVLAKPAEQTPIVAFLAVQLLNAAGLPPGVLQLLPGDGAIGAALVKDLRVAGVAFTGSNATGWAIQSALAERRAAMVPLIAETGGLNAFIADSSALPEQAIRDVVRSAFDSAGQRCSAARLFFVQEDVARPMLDMLVGAVEALDVGDPLDYATDIGPVIDQEAMERLEAHKLRMQKEAAQLVDLPMPPECESGTYVTPAVFEIADAGVLKEEVFGPILHVVRFPAGRIDQVIDAVNASGYGLTLGLHSRIAAVADFVAEHARVGNLYVNRNQIGAVVGVQPFGGEGLSGTGPKAGGPNYLTRFATERVRSTDITATGGNVALLELEEM
ncbi:MAG TPA: bifunctional proline dehydrogenase/L-glutamate gamma-semialdehyde dehydrogenase PutA [Hyphomicrobiaceae bacterium]|nr:bifunctional proline dehydrogenase/L-glutamate gamma-semialdehyde dehydrogenase PutA [Hyphomicrobiaceae bacterium]